MAAEAPREGAREDQEAHGARPARGRRRLSSVTLAVPAACAKCGKELPRGARAHLGIGDGARRSAALRLRRLSAAGVTALEARKWMNRWRPATHDGGVSMSSEKEDRDRSQGRSGAATRRTARDAGRRPVRPRPRVGRVRRQPGQAARSRQSAKTLEKVAQTLDDLQEPPPQGRRLPSSARFDDCARRFSRSAAARPAARTRRRRRARAARAPRRGRRT